MFFSEKNKELETSFNNFTNHFSDMNVAIKQRFNKSETSAQKIINICKKSMFQLSNLQYNFFESRPIINLIELKELRNRFLLSTKIKGNSKENQVFINIVSDVLKIISLLNEIYYMGFVQIIHINVKIENSKYVFEFISPSSVKEKYGEVLNKANRVVEILKNIMNDLKTNYTKAYENKEIMRYIYGRQFN